MTLLRPTLRLRHTLRRGVHDFVRGTTKDGIPYKVPLSSPKVVGIISSRGDRAYQEDRTSVCTVDLSAAEIANTFTNLRQPPRWTPPADGEPVTVSFFGIFDGHGGNQVSSFLQANLATIIESATPADIPASVSFTGEHGGYFKRWRGGTLRRWTDWTLGERAKDDDVLSLEERLTLAFLKADKEVHDAIGDKAWHCGSTASVVLLQSLDDPTQPHFASQKVHLTVAQVGDTRVLLADTQSGEVTALTDRHHAEARVEADRLRQMGTDRLVQDSFGETRWMGAIENTRGFGDFDYKPEGVTAEPEVSTRVIDGSKHAYLILVTDGLTSMLSDQELVDLARNASDPTRAAKTIVHFGEDLGAQDNCTCIVVPLAGWGHIGGEDSTEARREYRRQQAGLLNTRMQRM